MTTRPHACEPSKPTRATQVPLPSRRQLTDDVRLQTHNVVLIVLSAGMAASSVFWARAHGYSLWGNAYRASERSMGLTIYVFYVSKFYEFFDTVSLQRTMMWVVCTAERARRAEVNTQPVPMRR